MNGLRDDSGRVSVFLAIAFLAVIVLIGLVVDGGGQIQAIARADSIAAEAARAAGQAIDAPLAVSGGTKIVDPQLATRAAQAYLTSAGVTGAVVVADDRQHLVVTVVIDQPTVMLSLIGVDQIHVTGRATAELVTG